jgi:Domain of unknown function (DUF5666)
LKAHNLDRTALRLIVMAIGAGIIAACGGGVGSGGTGSGGPRDAISSGTITGFGSVVVDGTRFDDKGAATVTETEPGKDVLAEARLGNRVEVASQTIGAATSFRIEPAIVGSVSALTSNGFESLGQTVLVNTDATLGPVTQLGGYASAADVKVGDAVEVHGVYKATGTMQTVQATRIDKRTESPTFLRVSGLVQALGGAGNQHFQIGALTIDYSAASIAPTGAMLADGGAVTVFAPMDHFVLQAGGSPRLTATTVRVKALRSDGLNVYASGLVSQLDTAAGRFKLDGLTVNYASASIAPAGASLTNGNYVQARGMIAADGSMTASLVTLRDGKSQPEAELKGTIVGFDGTVGTFLVRDVLVTLANATLEGCPVSGLQNGLFVEIEGAMNAAGVIAKDVHCADEGAGSTIDRQGIASAVDTAASSFTLLRTGSTAVPVSWSSLTFFGGVTPQTLDGAKVEVIGVLVGGVLQASKIKRDD